MDRDGCVYLEMGKGKFNQQIIKRLCVIFTSGSKVFLEKMNVILNEKLKLEKTKIYRSHRSYQVRYNTSNSMKLFPFLYQGVTDNLYFKRKFDIFIRYFKLSPSKIDRSITRVLKHVGYGAVVK